VNRKRKSRLPGKGRRQVFSHDWLVGYLVGYFRDRPRSRP
jgi:hypothetical protein